MSLSQSDGIKQGTFTITIVFARSERGYVCYCQRGYVCYCQRGYVCQSERSYVCHCEP